MFGAYARSRNRGIWQLIWRIALNPNCPLQKFNCAKDLSDAHAYAQNRCNWQELCNLILGREMRRTFWQTSYKLRFLFYRNLQEILNKISQVVFEFFPLRRANWRQNAKVKTWITFLMLVVEGFWPLFWIPRKILTS